MIESDAKTRRRSQRVLLQPEVLLQLITAGRELRQVQALTSVVNAHGGSMEAPLKVAANQKITVGNPKSAQAWRARLPASCLTARFYFCFAITRPAIFLYVAAGMIFLFRRSVFFAYGRPSTIFWAYLSPIPGSAFS